MDSLKTEVSELKKELQQRKKLIAMQQQIIQHGTDNYNKVKVTALQYDYYLTCSARTQ